jgi:hypothetical protein
MMAELRGSVPKLPYAFTKTLVNRAWRNIREGYLWSFQIAEWAWITPPPLTTGAATFTQGLSTVTFDATAQAAITAWQAANPYALLTTQQFRGGNVAGLSGIYNIIAYDSGTGIATLDRIYADPSGTAASYTIFQCYYVPPMDDFYALLSVRNMQMFLDLQLDKTRSWIDARDPQRSWYQFPTHVVPFGADQRGVGTTTPSATLGRTMFELWGIPVTPFTYDVYALRRGTDLAKPTDALPFNIGEDMVIALAKYYAYEWAEANKDMEPRNNGPDYRFLMGQTMAWYRKLRTQYQIADKEAVDNFFHVREADVAAMAYGYYNTVAGVSGPYTQYGVIPFVILYLLGVGSAAKFEWNPHRMATIIFGCVFLATLLAISRPLRRKVEIISRKGMASLTNFLSRVSCWRGRATKIVLFLRDHFKMPRIAADGIPAKMVDGHSFRNILAEERIGDAMCVAGDFAASVLADENPTIGTALTTRSSSEPLPASGFAIDVNLGEKAKNDIPSIRHDGIIA